MTETYQTSPIDAAVEILWFNGIVVVTSAGNNGSGSGPVTLYPPANDPFVITVGAADDQGTTSLSDDAVATFSAYGTTARRLRQARSCRTGAQHLSVCWPIPARTMYVNHRGQPCG